MQLSIVSLHTLIISARRIVGPIVPEFVPLQMLYCICVNNIAPANIHIYWTVLINANTKLLGIDGLRIAKRYRINGCTRACIKFLYSRIASHHESFFIRLTSTLTNVTAAIAATCWYVKHTSTQWLSSILWWTNLQLVHSTRENYIRWGVAWKNVLKYVSSTRQ